MTARLFFLFAFFTGVVHGQSTRLIPVRTTVFAEDSVAVEFQALDRNGRSPVSLNPEQLDVVDDGRVIRDLVVTSSDAPMGSPGFIVFLMDVSGSMRGGTKMTDQKAFASALIKAMPDRDQCALIAFSAEPSLMCGFTNDKILLLDQLSRLTPAGATALYDAVFEALNHLEALPPESPKSIIIMSDGRDEGKSLFKLSDIAPRIASLPSIRIHAYDLNSTEPIDDLRRLTSLTSGTYVRAVPGTVDEETVASLVTQNRTVFKITYRSPEQSTTARRTVSIRLTTEGVQRLLSTSYQGRVRNTTAPSQTSSLFFAGSMLALIAGVVGLIVFTKRRRSSTRLSPFGRLEGVHERRWSPVMLGIPQVNDDERTRTLGTTPEGEDERTVILDLRPRVAAIYGTLLIDPGNSNEQRHPLDAPEILIGRSTQCKIQFDDHGVSRLHAKLRLEGGSFVIYDLGSANGTHVNGEEVQKRVLLDKDVIDIGEHHLEYRTETTVPL